MGKNEQLTKNDKAWNDLFERYDIENHILKDGYHKITADEVRTSGREPRLMAKFDHLVNRPKIFRDNDLVILPDSRGSYVIGQFDGYQELGDADVLVERIQLPTKLDTLDIQHIYSESAAIHCVNAVGILDDIFNDEFKQTISGRMGTGIFDFHVDTQDKERTIPIHVNNAQCEIDAGYESDNAIILIEAKNIMPEDFLVRQLYYPYRKWKETTQKPIIPIFMTYSNDIFDFFIYEFANPQSYNSLQLLDHKRYALEEHTLSRESVLQLLNLTKPTKDRMDIPFPQANSFERVIDLLNLLKEEPRSKEDLTLNYQFDVRQTDYYVNAGRYLGLIDRIRHDNIVMYYLNSQGNTVLDMPIKKRYLELIQLMIKHEFIHFLVHKVVIKNEVPSSAWIAEQMQNYELNLSKTGDTPKRRASTIRNWLNWIYNLIND